MSDLIARLEGHKAKMLAKRTARASVVPGWTKQGPMPLPGEILKLPLTSRNCGPRVKPSKGDRRAYRKSIWPAAKIAVRLAALKARLPLETEVT